MMNVIARSLLLLGLFPTRSKLLDTLVRIGLIGLGKLIFTLKLNPQVSQPRFLPEHLIKPG